MQRYAAARHWYQQPHTVKVEPGLFLVPKERRMHVIRHCSAALSDVPRHTSCWSALRLATYSELQVLPQAGPPLALDRDACGVTEAAVRSGRAGAAASRVALGYEVQRRRHGGASVTLHSGVEVGSCTNHGLSHARPLQCLATPVVCSVFFYTCACHRVKPRNGTSSEKGLQFEACLKYPVRIPCQRPRHSRRCDCATGMQSRRAAAGNRRTGPGPLGAPAARGARAGRPRMAARAAPRARPAQLPTR